MRPSRHPCGRGRRGACRGRCAHGRASASGVSARASVTWIASAAVHRASGTLSDVLSGGRRRRRAGALPHGGGGGRRGRGRGPSRGPCGHLDRPCRHALRWMREHSARRYSAAQRGARRVRGARALHSSKIGHARARGWRRQRRRGTHHGRAGGRRGCPYRLRASGARRDVRRGAALCDACCE